MPLPTPSTHLLASPALAATLAGVVAMALALRAQRARRGDIGGVTTWLAAPLVAGGLAVVLALMGTAVSSAAEVASAALTGSGRLDQQLGTVAIAVGAAASLGAFLPGWAWRRAHRSDAPRGRDAARAAGLFGVALVALALSIGRSLGPSALWVAPAVLAVFAAPLRAVMPGRGSRTDLRGRGRQADRAAAWLAILGMVGVSWGTHSVLRGAGLQVLAEGTVGPGAPVLVELTRAQAALAPTVALAMVALAAMHGAQSLVGAGGLGWGARRGRGPQALVAGAALVGVVATALAESHRSAAYDWSDSVADHLPVSQLPSANPTQLVGMTYAPSTDAPEPLVVRRGSDRSAGVGPWVVPLDPDHWGALPLDAPAARVAISGDAPARALTDAGIFRDGAGAIHLLVAMRGARVGGDPVWTTVRFDAFSAEGLRSAQEDGSPGATIRRGCVILERSVPTVQLPQPGDAVLQAAPGERVQGLVERCLTARASGADRCVLVPAATKTVAFFDPSADTGQP